MTPLSAVAALSGVGPGAPKPPDGPADAAKQLEVTFLTQLLQSMRKTVPDSDFLPKSAERDVYDGEFDRAVAEALAARDPLGLVQTLAQGHGASSSDGKMSITAADGQATGGSAGSRRSIP